MLKLPESLRSKFKKPYGKLTTIDKLRCVPYASVGDVVSYTLLSLGKQPQIVIFDGRSERKNFSKFFELINLTSDYLNLKAKNPPSTITSELVEVIDKAVKTALNGKKVSIFIEGEEDLALVPLICAIKSGTVVYGQPKKGVVEVEVNKEKKLQILQLMEQMEKVSLNGKNGEEIIKTCRRWVNGSIR